MTRKVRVLIIVLSIFISGCKTDPENKVSPAEELPPAENLSKGSPEAPSYSQIFTMNDITFEVSHTDSILTVTPSGLESTNTPLSVTTAGKVTHAETEDLDSDGWPEVIVYTRETDDSKKGHAYGFTTLNGKSLGLIYLAPMENDPELMSGYVGGDDFALVETSLVRRFVLNDGTTRQIQYSLKNGENSKVFVIDEIVEY